MLIRMKIVRQIVASLAIAIVTTATADTINVPGDFLTIQEALDVAIEGDEILVAAGTYTETLLFNGHGVQLRGVSGPKVTIIDATGVGGSVISIISGEGINTLVEGFTITGGSAFGPYGGGINVLDSSLIVENCWITMNTAGSGGGIAVRNGLIQINACNISNNDADTNFGGGIYSSNSSLSMANCTLFANTAVNGSGGGLYKVGEGFGFEVISGCSFIDNIADSAGGGIYNSGGDISFVNCETKNNQAGQGGGFYSGTGNFNYDFTGCTFEENDSGGIVIAIGSGLLTANECTFLSNKGPAIKLAQFAAISHCTFILNIGIMDGASGGIWNTSNFLMTITDSMFCNNYPSDIIGKVELRNMLSCPENCPADLDDNGSVNTSDLLALFANWGACPIDYPYCGNPAGGSCHKDNGSPGCDDVDCCSEVCAIDPACCEAIWDANCAAAAKGICIP